MRKIGCAAALLSAMVSSCRTTDGEQAEVRAATDNGIVAPPSVAPAPPPSVVMPPPATPQAPECPVPDAICSMEYEPVVCSAAAYRGRSLAEEAAVMAWGNNPCQGNLNLAREACHRGMLPSALGRSQCVPDGSNGQCPPAGPMCPPEPNAQPTVCTAATYGDQQLSAAQALKAWGIGNCVASFHLQMEACRASLDPKQLKNVTCVPDPTHGECPYQAPTCDDPPRYALCTAASAGGGVLAQPIGAEGHSVCEAKQALARLACRLDLKPSTLDQIVCKFEK